MNILRRAGALASLYAATIAPATAQVRPRRIELTETDLFSVESWTSAKVGVRGFHLGMQWLDVSTTAKGQKLHLTEQGTPGIEKACSGKGRCYVLDARNVFISLSVIFGEHHEITDLSVERPYSVGIDRRVVNSEVVRQFKGRTLLLFSQYSRDLRLRLLGTEAATETREGFTTFSYPATKPVEDPCSDVEVIFMTPAR
jgi:hypothetical protein